MTTLRALVLLASIEEAYHGMLGFSQPILLRDSFSGPHVTVSFGWLFGKGD